MDDRTMQRISEAKNGQLAGTGAIERRYGAGGESLNLTGAIEVYAGVESSPRGSHRAAAFLDR